VVVKSCVCEEIGSAATARQPDLQRGNVRRASTKPWKNGATL
jgi:hypothetical protein